jgi:hypothetical protein
MTPDPFQPHIQTDNKLILNIDFDTMTNEILVLNGGRLQTTIVNSSFQEFHNLHFLAKYGIANAGFSSIDWDSMFGGIKIQEEPTIKLPYVTVEPIELGLNYQGILVGSQTR